MGKNPERHLNVMEEMSRENAIGFRNFGRLATDFDNVPIEELMYRANIQRSIEDGKDYGTGPGPIPIIGFFQQLLERKETSPFKTQPTPPYYILEHVINTELTNANRMLRTASWVSVFYLITTDILGPTTAPYAISQLGFVPGSLLFFLLGICGAYGGYILYWGFLKLDSPEYPIANYGDFFGRLFGSWARFSVDGLQALQLMCNVGVIILGNGQGLWQIAQGKVCFVVLIIVWSFAGMIVGQVRTLQRFGFLSSLAIYMNLFVCFATMGVVAHSSPNYTAAFSQNKVPMGPVITQTVISGKQNFSLQLQATMNIVYSYGGAMMFVNFMAEMRRPKDFIKGMALAQLLIFTVYLLYGLFVYAYQGQFVINPANQGVNPYGWQTALNVISLASGLIAAGLYGNVGIKVVYKGFLKYIFKELPELETGRGRLVWTILVIVYWGVAYVVASAIPQFSTLTALVSSICILQFSYTFPPLIRIGLDMHLGAIKGDGLYDPITRRTNRIDTWWQTSRWIRGFKDRWHANCAHFVLFLASLTTAALGMYASVQLLIQAYAGGTNGAFNCKANI